MWGRKAQGSSMMEKRRLFLETFVAYFLSTGLIIASGFAAGISPMLPSSYVRWDSGHYLKIAASGYELFSCARVPGWDPAQWCGNSGWFPGYPLLIRVLSTLQISETVAGVLISNVCYFGCLFLLRLVLERAAPDRDNFACFLMGSVFPGAIYYHAVFPSSLLMLLALLALLLLVQGRYFWASLSAACGAFVYPTGFLLSGMLGLGVLIGRDMPWPRRLADAVMFSSIGLTGLLIVFLVHQVAVGRWDAFFLTQAKYGHGLHDPVGTIWGIVDELQSFRGNQEKFVTALQSFLTGLIVLGVFASLLKRIHKATPAELIAATQVALFWSFPLIMGRGVSLTRAEANLLPLVVLAAPLGRKAQSLILVIFAFLYFETNVSFFQSILV